MNTIHNTKKYIKIPNSQYEITQEYVFKWIWGLKVLEKKPKYTTVFVTICSVMYFLILIDRRTQDSTMTL